MKSIVSLSSCGCLLLVTSIAVGQTDFDFDDEDEAPKTADRQPVSDQPAARAEREPPTAAEGDESTEGVETNDAEKKGQALPTYPVHVKSSPEGALIYVGPVEERDGFGRERFAVDIDYDQLEEVCAAPCVRDFYEGRYSLALAKADGTPIRATETFDVRGPSELVGEYRSYQWMRWLGYATMAAGAAVGSWLLVSAYNECGASRSSCLRAEPRIWGGIGAFFIGTTGGLLMISKQDTVHFAGGPIEPGSRRP